MVELVVNQLEMSWRDKVALQDINLRLKGGEFTILIGPNGSGKSTLLKLLAGALKPTKGEVTFNGKSLADFSYEQLGVRRAVLSQSSTLSFPLSARTVVEMGLQQNSSYKKGQHFVESALEKVKASYFSSANYLQLSGGEQVRIQMARILVQLWSSPNNPEQMLYLDEPTSALDLKYQVELLNLCRELCDQGIGVFCILHDLQLAAHYADQLLVLNNGRIVEAGKAEDILSPGILNGVYDVNTCVINHPHTAKPMVMVTPG